MASRLWTTITDELAKQEKGRNLADLIRSRRNEMALEPKQTPDSAPIQPRGGTFRILPFIVLFILLFIGYSLYTAVTDSAAVRVSEDFIRRSPEIAAVVGPVRDLSLSYPFDFDTGNGMTRANLTFTVEGSSGSVKVYLVVVKSRGTWRVVAARYEDARGLIRPLGSGALPEQRGSSVAEVPAGDGRSASLARGHAFLKANDPEKAAAEYSRVIEKEPSGYNGYYWRGVAYARMKKNSEAFDDFRRVVGMAPNHAGAFNWLGWLHYKNGQYDEAIAHLSRSIKLRGNNGWAYFQRGQCYLGKGLRSEARNDFLKACSLRFNKACSMADRLKANI